MQGRSAVADISRTGSGRYLGYSVGRPVRILPEIQRGRRLGSLPRAQTRRTSPAGAARGYPGLSFSGILRIREVICSHRPPSGLATAADFAWDNAKEI